MEAMQLAILEKPQIYQSMEIPFWDDEHISKQMLAAHLDPETDAASRKLEFIDRSASWIRLLVSSEDSLSLIDVGCGPGLYAERFAKLGFRVTGVDFSRRSIQYAEDSAKSQGLSIEYVHQNYLDLHLNRQFDFCTMIYCDFGVLSPKDRQILLDNVYRHLRPGGKFLFDVFSMAHYHEFTEGKDWDYCPTGGFWRDCAYLVLNSKYKYPPHTTCEHITVFSGNDSASYYLWDTYWTKDTLAQEIAGAGFQVVDYFSDISGIPYSEDSPTLAILLEKPKM